MRTQIEELIIGLHRPNDTSFPNLDCRSRPKFLYVESREMGRSKIAMQFNKHLRLRLQNEKKTGSDITRLLVLEKSADGILRRLKLCGFFNVLFLHQQIEIVRRTYGAVVIEQLSNINPFNGITGISARFNSVRRLSNTSRR